MKQVLGAVYYLLFMSSVLGAAWAHATDQRDYYITFCILAVITLLRAA